MKKALTLFILLSLIGICLADPDWEPVIYTNSTVAYCQVKIDEINAFEGDLVGAFVEGECRGVGEIFLFETDSYSTMNIQGNLAEDVSFLVWDQSTDTECAVEFMTMSYPGHDIGYPPDYLPVFALSGNPVNHYPVMELPESLVIPEDIATTYDFGDYCWDEDGDALSITGATNDYVTVNADGLIVTLTSSQDWFGIYYVTFWLSDGVLSVHDSLEVFVTAINDPPVITDTYPAAGDIEVEEDDPVSFAVIAHDVDSALIYSWYVGGILQSCPDHILNYTFEQLGDIEVSCTIDDGSYQVQALWNVTVNINPVIDSDIETLNRFWAYPNPCNDSVYLNWELQRSLPKNISIYDIRGRKVMIIPASSRSGSVLHKDMSKLPAGRYFAKLATDANPIVIQFTIK